MKQRKSDKAVLVALDARRKAANASETPDPAGMFCAGLSPCEREQLDGIRRIRESQAYELPLHELRRLADLQLLQNAAENKPLGNADIKIRIGRNINKLRKELGWSYDDLENNSEVDKKSIISHVHGRAKPNVHTQWEYARVFSLALNRPITAPDLEK